MAIQLSTTLRNNMANQLEATVGTSARLKVFTGAPPANCAAADSGTLLADLTLPSDWLGAAASGTVAKSGTWSDAAADGAGTAGYYRIYDSALAACHLQGTVTATGGGGDMTVDNAVFAVGQAFSITSWSLTVPNS
jgi:hypothetical protein